MPIRKPPARVRLEQQPSGAYRILRSAVVEGVLVESLAGEVRRRPAGWVVSLARDGALVERSAPFGTLSLAVEHVLAEVT